MRLGVNYNSVLTLASDAEGIYMGVMVLFRIGHPRLFIPWGQIQVEEPRRWLFFMAQRLYLGPDRIPLRLRMRPAQFLLEPRGGENSPAAGTVSSTF